MSLAGFSGLPLPLAQLSLAAVLQCGQSFRWSRYHLGNDFKTPEDYEYRLCLRDRLVCLRQSSTTLYYRTVTPLASDSDEQRALREAETLIWVNDYFQLDIDLPKLYVEWAARDKVFDSLKERFEGIRMLRQDPWENLVSFICSSNNNISRITKMVQSLCSNFSPPLLSAASPVPDSTEVIEYYPFPPPSALSVTSTSATLRGLGFGYRADFIQKTSQMLVDAHNTKPNHPDGREPAEHWLESIRALPTAEARNELVQFMGVGRKVADCVLLMSMDKKEVIPVDTHVHQIAVKHYGMKSGNAKGKTTMNPKLYDEINAKFVGIWGEYAGWAHSVLFTSDLKAFAAYGLANVSSAASTSPTALLRGQSTPSTPQSGIPRAKRERILPTPPRTPAPSRKRKLDEAEDVRQTDSSAGSLAERVKRRQR